MNHLRSSFCRAVACGFVLAFSLLAGLPAPAQTITTKTLDFGSLTTGNTGFYSSQAIVNGKPAIAYYNSTEANLMFARNSAADGSGTWTIMTVDYVGAMGQYTSLVVVNGNPAICYLDQTNGDLKYVRALDASGTSWGTPVTVDSAGSVGYFTSMAVVDGNPAISYWDGGNSDLKYVRASDSTGASWGTAVTLDSTGSVGYYSSLVVVWGSPAISYYDFTNGNLKYIRANNTTGTLLGDWGAPVVIDSTGDVGLYTSMVLLIDGTPAISYYANNPTGDLKFVRANDPTGTSWGTPVTIDSTGDVGQFTSMAVVNGLPAISYYDVTNTNLKYVQANDFFGASWGTPLTVENSAGTVGQYSSLAVVGGTPAISYYDQTNTALKTVRASDPIGASWPTATTVDPGTQAGSVGQYTSQAIVNGNPAIAYYDVSANDLRYVRALDAAGTSWGTPVTVEASVGTVGQYCSLAVVDGRPAISYYDQTNGDLKYVRALDASGTSWGTPVTLDSTGNVGLFTSLVVVDGTPAISYYDQTNLDLKYVRALDASGTSWGTPLTLDGSLGTVGQYSSLAVVNGKPAISYYDQGNTDLKYVRALDASGASWDTPVTLDGSLGVVGLYTSLVVVDGNPAISYYDGANLDLKYVRALDASGTSWGAPISLDTAISSGQYISMAVVNGNPAISYYDGTNGDLRYVRANTASGTQASDWGTPVTFDSTGIVGQYTSMVVVNGSPAISYFDATNGNLKWATYVTATAPTVSAPTSANVTASTATLGGNVTADGGGAITERGVVYSSTDSNPTTATGTKVTASGTTGVFTAPVSGLSGGTTYYFKAYATNSVGTGYTSVGSFTTPAAFANGGFETNGGNDTASAAGWVFSPAHATVLSNQGTAGSYGVTFGSGNMPADTVLSQAFVTVPGQTYAVGFDYGGGGPDGMGIGVKVVDGSSPAGTTQLMVYGSGVLNAGPSGVTMVTNTTTISLRDYDDVYVFGQPAPNERFAAVSFVFTAQSSVSTIVFTDESNATDGVDTFLDNVVIAPATASVSPVIQPDAVSTSYATLDGAIGRTINQSGLTLGYADGVTDFATYIAAEPTHGGQTANVWYGTGSSGTVTFDLGTSVQIGAMAMWIAGAESIGQFTLVASNDVDFTSTTTLGTFSVAVTGTEGARPAQVFSFAPTMARFFRLNVLTQTSANTISLGEVAFKGVPPNNVPALAVDGPAIISNVEGVVGGGGNMAGLKMASGFQMTTTTALGAVRWRGNMTVAELWSDDGTDKPGVRLLSLTSTGAGRAVPPSPFTLMAGTKYWVVWDNTVSGGSNVSLSNVVPAGSGATFLGNRFQGGAWNIWSSMNFMVAVEAPSLTEVVAVEGSAATVTGTFSDADGNGTVTLSASSGAITQNNTAGTWSWTKTSNDGPASETITITATDTASATATATFDFTVTNAVPVAAITAPATAELGASVSISFTATDASSVDEAAGFTWTIDYGDGSGETTSAGTVSSVGRTHTYASTATYLVTVTATDKDGGVSTAASHAIVVSDTMPPSGGTFTFSPASPVLQGNGVTLSAPGWSDPTGPVNYLFYLGSTPLGTASASNTRAISPLPIGSYTVSVEISDQLGNTRTEGPLAFSVVGTQAISFTLPASVLMTSSIPLSATGGASGNPVTFSIVSGPGSITGNTLSFSAGGNVVVRASQAGDASYLAAPDVERTIVVIDPTVTAVDDLAYAASAAIVIDVLANDSTGYQTLSLLSVGAPASGGTTAIVPGNKVRFTPTGPVAAPITFTYTATNGAETGTGTVTVKPISLLAGTYVGLLRGSDNVVRGSVKVVATATGTFTGSIWREGGVKDPFGNAVWRACGFKGGFANPAVWVPSPYEKVFRSHGITLVTGVEDVDGRPQLVVTSPGLSVATLTGTLEKAPYHATSNPVVAARYTAVAERPVGVSGVPATAAALTLQVATSGTVTVVGKFGDGRAISQSVPMVSGQRLFFYQGAGYGAVVDRLGGVLTIDPGATPQVQGSLDWGVAPGAISLVPTAVAQAYPVRGYTFVPALTTPTVFNPASNSATLTMALPVPVVRTLNLTGLPTLAFTGGSVTLNRTTGAFSGSRVLSRTVSQPIYGVILQGGGVHTGYGWLQVTGSLPSVTITTP